MRYTLKKIIHAYVLKGFMRWARSAGNALLTNFMTCSARAASVRWAIRLSMVTVFNAKLISFITYILENARRGAEAWKYGRIIAAFVRPGTIECWGPAPSVKTARTMIPYCNGATNAM